MTRGVDGPYEQLRERVDAFAAQVAERHRDAMSCRAGCDGCCQVQLTVSPIEADAIAARLADADDALRSALSARTAAVEAGDRGCVFLVQGRCSVYSARPLVCRSQGLPLRYPAGVLPPETVRATAGEGEVTWCPLNFESTAPGPADVLDAERVDVTLGAILRATRPPEDADARIPLLALARTAADGAR